MLGIGHLLCFGIFITKMSDSCYACESIATSREHIPPRCLFPKGHRHDLITVPSCDVHNLKKSRDDEYLRHVLACAPGNNDLCLSLIEEGILPSFDYRSHLVETFLPDLQAVSVRGMETGSFSVDLDRFFRSIGAIVKGLYFYNYRKQLTSEFQIAWGSLVTSDLAEAPFYKLIRNAENQLRPINRGANPRVFAYAFDASKGGSIRLCRLRFFEGHPIYATWKVQTA